MPDTPLDERNEQAQNDDPVTSRSLTGYYVVASLLLMLSLAWALYDEFYGLRPWKRYQGEFVRVYAAWLKKKIPEAAAVQKAIEESPEYQKLDEEWKSAEAAITARRKEISAQMGEVNQRLSVVSELFTTARGEITALTYAVETGGAARDELEKAKRRAIRASLPLLGAGGKTERVSFQYEELEAEYNRLRGMKAGLQTELADLLKPISELRQKRDTYLQEHLGGLTQQQMKGLRDKLDNFKFEIKQINLAEAQLVDRCESCHLAIREPVSIPRAEMVKLAGKDGAAFTSHPNPELLKVHDPERFGCSPCHGGNGRATTGVEKAHGLYHHWLWPLWDKENAEAGCHQCHTTDLVLKHATTINEGKELFRWKGCHGCHRFEGFDPEPEQLFNTRQTIRKLEDDRRQAELESQRLEDRAAKDTSLSDEQVRQVYQQAENLRVSVSRIDARLEQVDLQAKNLLQEIKKVGPSLKEVRVRLRKEWIPVWLENPHAFRPTTKMPRFRLEKEEREAIAAFVWQSGVAGRLPAQTPGDPARGKELLETRGCLACHSIGEGPQAMGGTFAANLSRVGEKTNYDYLVRWIHNPRERTLPYCPYEKRDIGPDDYARKGLPFVFDLDHSKCPNDGHELQVQQMTIMPNLRLSWQEARDIATYLMTQKKVGPSAYPPASYLDEPKMKQRGLVLVRNYGCAGCHEIAALEEEGRIGTELTNEGSKPIERLDFALLTRQAQNEDWYDHKGFFGRKLADPAVFDKGRLKPPTLIEGDMVKLSERLKMPNFELQKPEITALTTFLLGAADPTIPQFMQYRPADQRRDIQEGWWIVKKYNCQGCHVVEIGQASVLMTLPRYQQPDWKEQLPPRLTSEGARVSPQWLIHFLKNPAMSETETDRNGVRPYLKARMPTFFFSDSEVRKLVRFFEAMSYQPQPYIEVKLEPLTPQEQAMARQLFTHPAAPCLKCHATGDPAHDRTATAPNFLLAKERLKPGWTERWLVDPARISPGTSMPSGLFRRDGSRWVFAGPTPASFQGYPRDHVELLVRYMFQFTSEEQRRLGSGGARSTAAGAAASGLN